MIYKSKLLLSTVCKCLFCVIDAEQSGIGGYSGTGMNNVLTSVVLILGVKLVNLLCLYTIALPSFLILIACPINLAECILKPSSLPSVLVLSSFAFIAIFLILRCAIGIILNFSSLVFIFYFSSNLFIVSISLSIFSFIISFDLLGVVITCCGGAPC